MAALPRILLVDDAPDVRALLRTKLRLTKRFEVVGEAADGRDALRLAEELRPDLVLLDVSMPGMDGLEALTAIRAAVPETKVVMFSGFEEHGLADKALSLGATSFIEKSVTIDDLAERLAALLGDEPLVGAPVEPGPEPVLLEHLERFRAAFDDAAIGMATLTLAGRVVRANAAFEKLADRRSSELIGERYDNLVDEPFRADFARQLDEVASGESDSASVEHLLTGAPRWLVSTVAVVRDTRREPLYLFLQAQDTTDRRNAEEELRRSEERFRLLVEGVGDYAIFMLDPDGNIASWNLGAERSKGYTADEIVGRHFSTFYPQEAVDAGHPQYELRRASAEGRYEEEGWRVRKDGTMFFANVLITAIRDATGELIGYAKVTRDVTERQVLLDELADAAEQRAQFLAVTAHELRTPVAVINGFASTLRDHWGELEEAERREMAAALARGGERLSRLVDDLLTASRLEAGMLEVAPMPIDMVELIDEVVRDLGGGDVTAEVPSVRVLADRGRLQQMIGNYVTNALRYGAPPVAITGQVEDGFAVIRVSDSGAGVEPELVPRLYGKFERGSSRDGTGLGLFIVRELARAHGGDAWYEPAPAGGSCFALRLPLAG